MNEAQSFVEHLKQRMRPLAPGVATSVLSASVIAAAGFVGFGLSFAYELGYCLYFDVPVVLIKVDVGQIALALIGSLTAIWIALHLLRWI